MPNAFRSVSVGGIGWTQKQVRPTKPSSMTRLVGHKNGLRGAKRLHSMLDPNRTT